MLYSSLTTAELERWVRASPSDGMALAEMTRRGPKLLRHECEVVDNLEAEIAMLEDRNKAEVGAALSDLLATEARLKILTERVTQYQNSMRNIVLIASA